MILNGDESCGNIGRQGLQIRRRGQLAPPQGDHGAGPVEIGHRRLAMHVVELGGIGQVRGEDQQEAGGEDQTPDAQHQAPVDQGL